MKQRTIIEAISKVLKDKDKALSIKDIYDQIVDNHYYKFNAQNPYNVVRVEIRRHFCVFTRIKTKNMAEKLTNTVIDNIENFTYDNVFTTCDSLGEVTPQSISPRLRSKASISGSAPRKIMYISIASLIPPGSRMFLRNEVAVV